MFCQQQECTPTVLQGGHLASSRGAMESDEKFVQLKGLLAAKVLVCPKTGAEPVRIVHPYDHGSKLYRNYVVVSYEPIEPDQLLTVNSVQIDGNLPTTCSGTDTCSDTDTCSGTAIRSGTDTRSDRTYTRSGADLPEHLKTLCK